MGEEEESLQPFSHPSSPFPSCSPQKSLAALNKLNGTHTHEGKRRGVGSTFRLPLLTPPPQAWVSEGWGRRRREGERGEKGGGGRGGCGA